MGWLMEWDHGHRGGPCFVRKKCTILFLMGGGAGEGKGWAITCTQKNYCTGEVEKTKIMQNKSKKKY